MQRRVLALCGLLSWTVASAFVPVGPAWAQSAQGPVERTVITKDGSMYRGEVLEYVISSHITLKLSSGESKRIAWDEIDQVSPPKAKAPAAAPSPSPAPPPSSPSPPSSMRKRRTHSHLPIRRRRACSPPRSARRASWRTPRTCW